METGHSAAQHSPRSARAAPQLWNSITIIRLSPRPAVDFLPTPGPPGPGYPIPSVSDTDEPWKNNSDEPKYVPLQPRVGDQAVYIQNNAIEIEFNKEKYIVVSQSAILLLLRDNGLFE